MKTFFLSLIILFSVNIFAQVEMDTTLVVNANGDTIGIIHKKGEQAVLPSNVLLSSPETQSEATLINSTYADSIAYYEKIVNKYTVTGNKMRSVGKGLMLGGGIGFGVGATLMIIGLSDTKEDYYGDEEMTDSGATLFVMGYVLALTMPELFIAGVVVKCVGSAKLRRAKRYNEKVNNFKNLNASLASLRMSPIVNPVTGALGGNLAFNF